MAENGRGSERRRLGSGSNRAIQSVTVVLAQVLCVGATSAQPREPAVPPVRWGAGAEVGATAPSGALRYGGYAASEVRLSTTLRLRFEPAFMATADELNGNYSGNGVLRQERTVIALLGRAFAGFAFTPWLTGYLGAFAGVGRGKLVSSSTGSASCGNATLVRPVFGAALGLGARTAPKHGVELGVLAELGKGYPFGVCNFEADTWDATPADPPYRSDGLFAFGALVRVGYTW